MPITRECVEVSVIGTGHTVWIALQGSRIIGLTAVSRKMPNQMTILCLQISDSNKNSGVGSALIKSVIAGNPTDEFTAVPVGGTDEFYSRLGFSKSGHWEMCRPAEASN
ncbi:MAG: GNAT family N-acetyltransferase [Candidatus Bathyarchaeia archaeon]|jgi:N-acetylglutamate synthase-like GNAT family acetyltransferase